MGPLPEKQYWVKLQEYKNEMNSAYSQWLVKENETIEENIGVIDVTQWSFWLYKTAKEQGKDQVYMGYVETITEWMLGSWPDECVFKAHVRNVYFVSDPEYKFSRKTDNRRIFWSEEEHLQKYGEKTDGYLWGHSAMWFTGRGDTEVRQSWWRLSLVGNRGRWSWAWVLWSSESLELSPSALSQG